MSPRRDVVSRGNHQEVSVGRGALTAERATLADLPRNEYDGLTSGSFFASPGFLDLWRTRGGRPVVWTARLDGAIAGILPGVEFGAGLLSRFVSLPDGCYGGLFLDLRVGCEAERVSAGLLSSLGRHGYGRVHIFDARSSLPDDEGFDLQPCAATHIELSERSDWPADAKLRSQIRKAEREGIVVVRYDPARHRTGLLELARLTYRRHGLPPRYPASFFDALGELAKRDSRIQWAWCEHNGEPVCSHVYFVEGGALQAWQSFFDKRFSFLKPNAYIRHRVARESLAAGIRRLNLGCTPEGATGLAYYKARWGGRRVWYPSLVRMSGAFSLAKRVAARSGWRPVVGQGAPGGA